MRTCMDGCQALQPAELAGDGAEFAAAFVVVSGYSLYTAGLAQAVIKQAAQARCPLGLRTYVVCGRKRNIALPATRS